MNLGGDHDPIPAFQLGGSVIPAGNAAELDVLHAAGHDEPTRSEHTVLVPAEHGYLTLEPDGFAVVLLRLLGDIPIPQGEVLVLDLHNGSVDVKGQGS